MTRSIRRMSVRVREIVAQAVEHQVKDAAAGHGDDHRRPDDA